MIPSFAVLLVASSGLCASGVSITADKSIMRSEQAKAKETKGSLQLSASGSLSPSHDSSPSHKSDEADCTSEWDFDLGEDSCDCRTPERRLTQLQCQEAAGQAGATAIADENLFQIGWYYEHRRPLGCFKFACAEDPRGICYFFNGIAAAGPDGSGPAKCTGGPAPIANEPVPEVTGTPVCKRHKYQNGTVDDNGGCPDGYEVIQNEDNCTAAAGCQDYCTGAEFREGIANESAHNDYPEGCFIHKADTTTIGCVYLNTRLLATDGTPRMPTNPQGTPICRVSHTVSFTGLPVVNTVTAAEAVHSAPAPTPAPITFTNT